MQAPPHGDVADWRVKQTLATSGSFFLDSSVRKVSFGLAWDAGMSAHHELKDFFVSSILSSAIISSANATWLYFECSCNIIISMLAVALCMLIYLAGVDVDSSIVLFDDKCCVLETIWFRNLHVRSLPRHAFAFICLVFVLNVQTD